jgi:hypothetical protein
MNRYLTWKMLFLSFIFFISLHLPCQVICHPLSNKVKVKQSIAGWTGPEGSRRLRLPDFMTFGHEGGKVVSPMHWLSLPPGNIPGTHFF